MDIRELEWDDDNRDHIGRHGISADEVDELCLGDPWEFRGRSPNRKFLLGETHAGRRLFVVVERQRRGVYRPVTAREMNPSERRRYDRLWRRS